jgi:flagellar biogenesis protein FliO
MKLTQIAPLFHEHDAGHGGVIGILLVILLILAIIYLVRRA